MGNIGVLAGLIVMFCWGIAGFIQSFSSKRIGPSKTMFISNAIALLYVSGVHALFFKDASVSMSNLVVLLISGVFMAAGLYNLYRAYEIGDVSIVTPISQSNTLITVFLAIMILGEKLEIWGYLSIFLIISGIALASNLSFRSTKGVKPALLAMLFLGLNTFFIGIAAKDVTLLGIHFEGCRIDGLFIFSSYINQFIMLTLSALKHGIPKKKDFSVVKGLLFSNILFGIAWFAFNYGISRGFLSVVSPVSSLNPLITIILAAMIFKEQISAKQKLGILSMIAGIVLISL